MVLSYSLSPNLAHSAVALKNTLDVDVFSPPPKDWPSKPDADQRKKTRLVYWFGQESPGPERRGSLLNE